MGSVEKVTLHLNGVREVVNDPKVIADCERRARAIAAEATSNALEHYDNLGYKEKEIYMTKTTKTVKHGNAEAIVFANPGIKLGNGQTVGDRAQAEHSSLTQAIDAGRS